MVGLALLASLGCGRPGFETRPNVVLITVDTLRADRLGSYAASWWIRSIKPSLPWKN